MTGEIRNTAEHQDPKICSDADIRAFSECGKIIIKNQRGIIMMIVSTRSEYFKTALSTAVGEQKRVIDVQECSAQVIIATFATFANATFWQKCCYILCVGKYHVCPGPCYGC